MAGLKVKPDCFAYLMYEKQCHALTELVCMDKECPFYKTAKERCDGCKEAKTRSGFVVNCDECKRKGIIKAEV